MAAIDDLEQNVTDLEDLGEQLIARIVASDAREAALNAEIAGLVAAANMSAAEKAALQARIDAAVARSQALEDKERAAIPGVPPVGGSPLNPSYADRASFDAAVAAYTGPEQVSVDGSEVKAGTSPAIEYFTHSADGSVSTSGPTD